MAGLTRKTSLLFGDGGPTSAFGQFGSKIQFGTGVTSKDPTTIQGLPARWQQGWQNAVVSGDKAAFIEDMNGFCYVDSYQITYLMQMGVPEYDSATLYFTGSIIQIASTGQQFKSLQGGVPGVGAGQSGNTPPTGASNAFWLWINPPQDLVGTATLNKLPKVTSTAPSNGVPGSVTLSDSAVSDDGTDVIISLPLKFPDNTVQTTAATSSVTQRRTSSPWLGTPTGTRAWGIVYQNLTGKALFVASVTDSGAARGLNLVTDSSPTPTTIISSVFLNGSGVSGIASVFGIVLPNDYYVVNYIGGGSPSLVTYAEWN